MKLLAAGGHDAERQRVYDAEDAAFLDTSYAERLGERGCRWLIERLTATPWWSEAACGVVPALRAARADSARSAAVVADGRAEVRIGPGMDQAHVLSHELAHVLAGADAGHRSRFRAAHLDLATIVLGTHGAGRLIGAYGRAGLAIQDRRWPPPSEHGPGGLLAMWEARLAVESFGRCAN